MISSNKKIILKTSYCLLVGLSAQLKRAIKIKIETSTVIEEMKQSMDGDYSDVFSSVWNDTLFFVQFNYDSSVSVMLFMYDMNIKNYSY